MRLHAQSPLRMLQAVFDREVRILLAVGAIHRLQVKVSEVQPVVLAGLGFRLRVDQLQFITGNNDQFGTGFGADTDPVDAGGDGSGSVRFDGNFESA